MTSGRTTPSSPKAGTGQSQRRNPDAGQLAGVCRVDNEVNLT